MKRASHKRNANKAIPEVLEGRNRVEAFEKLRKEGLTLEQIGKRFNISRQRVHQILNKSKRKMTRLRPLFREWGPS